MKSILLGLSVVLTFPVYASQTARIVLDDGSTVYGEFLAFDGDSYSIESPTLGAVRIPASKVTSFEVGRAARETANSDADSPLQEQMRNMQEQISGNSQLMERITALQSNPAVQEILADEKLMRAINNSDTKRLMNDPRLERLMQDPQLQSIRRLLAP
jgi:hypothetical protein